MNIDSAEGAKEFVGIEEKDIKGRATILLVPGHDGRQYRVYITRLKAKRILIHCENAQNKETCNGNKYKNICYHCIAALMKATQKTGQVEFFTTEEPGSIKVQSVDGRGNFYMLVSPNDKTR